MDAFLVSTLAVAIAEIGDKTQLLSLVLAARLRRPWAITLGILGATLLNHAAAAWLGNLVRDALGPEVLRYLMAGAFIALGLWVLKPDRCDDQVPCTSSRGALLLAFALFFAAEMGDKTQIATVALAARFDDLLLVVAGTTVGMMLANVPVVFMGERIARRMPLVAARRIAAVLFVSIGVAVLAGAGAA